MLIPPRALQRNGHVAVLAISSPSEMPRIEAGVRTLESRGLRVTLASNIDHRHRGYLAGDDDERLEQLNHYLRSDDVDAFFFARGGYGAMRILDRIDYDAITANPRPIIGFSDITALHQAVAVRCGVGSFHGPMVNLDWFEGLTPDIEQWFWSMLAGDAPLTHRFERDQVVFEGEAEGILFGGCLSLTTALDRHAVRLLDRRRHLVLRRRRRAAVSPRPYVDPPTACPVDCKKSEQWSSGS